MENLDEADLVDQARTGSIEAFTLIVQRFQHRVRGYVAGIVGDRAEVVDDVAQETFLAAYRSLATYDASRVPFGAWLSGIARNRALTFLRDEGRRRRREQDQLEGILASGRLELAEQLDDRDQRLDALAACLERLPPQSRTLIDARYRRAVELPDLARTSGRAEAAVRMALSRVRDVLRRCIEQRAVAP